MGIADSAKVVTINVKEEDSLTTIANKINGAYMSNDGAPSKPEEWLRASVEQAPDGTYYLTLESQVIGEAQRINVLAMKTVAFTWQATWAFKKRRDN